MPFVSSSFGVSPAIVRIDFKPNLSMSFEMILLNNKPEEATIAGIYTIFVDMDKDVADELEDSITLEKSSVSFAPGELTKNLRVYINFPEGVSKPGNHEFYVGAVELKEKGEGIAVIAANNIRVMINVSEEYADLKYAKIKDLEILEIRIDDIYSNYTNLTVKVKSKAEVDLKNVYANAKFEQENQEILNFNTSKIDLKPGEEKEMKKVFSTKTIKPGVLTLYVEVFYDSKSEKATRTIFVSKEPVKGLVLEERRYVFWIWIIGIILLILLILLIVLFLLSRRRKEERENSVQRKV